MGKSELFAERETSQHWYTRWTLNFFCLSLSVAFLFVFSLLNVQASALVRKYSKEASTHISQAKRSALIKSITSQMSCSCPKRESDPCIEKCTHGRNVVVSKRCWAGDVNSSDFGGVFDRKSVLTCNRTGDATQNSCGAADSITPQYTFAAGVCDNFRCFSEGRDNTWVVTKDSGCSSWCRCGGIYCSRCLKGYSLLPSSVVSEYTERICADWRLSFSNSLELYGMNFR